MSWYFAVLKKYAVFSGRARRKEYWMFGLFNVIIVMVLALIEGIAGIIAGIAPGDASLLVGIYALAVLIPSLAVANRRLHDTNRTGWWMFIPLVPVIGSIVIFVFLVKDSQLDENQYGPNPKTLEERDRDARRR